MRRADENGFYVAAPVQALNALRQLRHHGDGEHVVGRVVQGDACDVVGDIEVDELELFGQAAGGGNHGYL